MFRLYPSSKRRGQPPETTIPLKAAISGGRVESRRRSARSHRAATVEESRSLRAVGGNQMSRRPATLLFGPDQFSRTAVHRRRHRDDPFATPRVEWRCNAELSFGAPGPFKNRASRSIIAGVVRFAACLKCLISCLNSSNGREDLQKSRFFKFFFAKHLRTSHDHASPIPAASTKRPLASHRKWPFFVDT